MVIIFSFIIAISVISTFIINRFIFLDSYVHLEEKQILEKSDGIKKLISRSFKNLDNTCIDWAHWDDTYEFASDLNQDYIDSNFADAADTLATIDVSLIVFTDKEGNIIYSNYFDSNYENPQYLPEEITALSKKWAQVFSDEDYLNGEENNIGGIINLGNNSMLIAANPVLTSTSAGPPNGILLMGRHMDRVIETIAPVFEDTDIEIIYLNESGINAFNEIKDDKKTIADSGSFKINYPGRFFYSSYSLINDIYENPSIIIKTTGARDIYLFGQNIATIVTIIVALMTTLIGIITITALNVYFFRRIYRLSRLVEKIGRDKSLSQRIKVSGNDEISTLEKSINSMLGDLEKSQDQAIRAKKMYADLFEYSIDGIYRSNLQGQYINVNDALVKMLGYKNKNELLSVNTKDIYCENKDRPELHTSNKTYGACLKRKDGNKLYVEISTRIVLENRMPAYYEGIVRDITERKQNEERIKYISFHDSLTDLYNRAYFEEEMKRLKKTRNLPITIIYGDVNNLKEINDSQGHEAGDVLLRKIAAILKDCFREEDVVARVGGDEFCIILPGTDGGAAEKIIERVNKKCAGVSTDKLLLSVAFGINTKTAARKNLWKLLKEAEDRMYKNKKLIKDSKNNTGESN